MSKLSAGRAMCWLGTLLFAAVAVDLLLGGAPAKLGHGLAASFGVALFAVSAAFDARRTT